MQSIVIMYSFVPGLTHEEREMRIRTDICELTQGMPEFVMVYIDIQGSPSIPLRKLSIQREEV
jgi:hypothetical protein